MKYLGHFSFLLLLWAAGCSSESGIDPAPRTTSDQLLALSKRNVPISGGLSGSVTPILLTNGFFRWEVTASGNMSHMGRVTASIIFPEVEVDIPNGRMIVRSGTWTGVLTAANGDQLFGRYTVRNGSTTIDLAGNVTFVADLEVTGGTGRFLEATGSGITVGQGNIGALSFSTSVQGSISHVGNP